MRSFFFGIEYPRVSSDGRRVSGGNCLNNMRIWFNWGRMQFVRQPHVLEVDSDLSGAPFIWFYRVSLYWIIPSSFHCMHTSVIYLYRGNIKHNFSWVCVQYTYRKKVTLVFPVISFVLWIQLHLNLSAAHWAKKFGTFVIQMSRASKNFHGRTQGWLPEHFVNIWAIS